MQTDHKLADRLAGATGPLRVLHLLDDEQVNIRDVSEAVEADGALSESLIRIARSPLYGLTSSDISVGRAVVLLGLTTVKHLAVMSACEHLTDEHRPDLVGFWDHALMAAVVAERLAERVDADSEQAFMAGLLHDVGEISLMDAYDDYTIEVLAQCGGSLEQAEVETARYGTNHIEAGVATLSGGPFAPEVVGAITHHHDRVLTTRPMLDRVIGAADRMAQRLRQAPRASRDELDTVLRDAGLDVYVDGALLVEIRRGHEAMRLALGQ